MAKPPSDNPRGVNISLKLTKDEGERLDKERGAQSKSSFIRDKVFP